MGGLDGIYPGVEALCVWGRGCNTSHGAGVLDGIFVGDIQRHSERRLGYRYIILPIYYMFSLNFHLLIYCGWVLAVLLAGEGDAIHEAEAGKVYLL